MNPGVYENIPFAEYASWPGYNPSLIKLIHTECPKAMRHVQLSGSEMTEPLTMGKATHTMLFEPDKFSEQFVRWQKRRQGKEWDAFKEEHETAGREILTENQYADCVGMVEAVRASRPATEILAPGGRRELSIVWRDPATEALCKGRVDYVSQAGSHHACLKTAACASPYAFQSQAAKLLYHVSMAAYTSGLWENGIHVEKAYFVVVGKRPWHDVACCELSDAMLNRGQSLWEEGLSQALACEKMQHWPGACPEIHLLELPEWAQAGKAHMVTLGGESAFGDDE